MAQDLRVGLLGIENSHSVAYTRLWQGEVPEEERVRGARVVACLYQGRTDQDAEDEKKFLAQLQAMGVEKVVARPEDMVGQVDAAAIVSRAGDEHLALAEPFLKAGLPTFVDKPLADHLDIARKILALARGHKAPLFSASPVRYYHEVTNHQQNCKEVGRVMSGSVWSPAHRDIAVYGIHAIEMMSALWGPGARWVSAFHGEDKHVAWVGYENGGIYAVHLLRYGAPGFGFTYFGEKKTGTVQASTGGYVPICRLMTQMFRDRKPPLDPEVSLESIAILEAFRRSQDGAVVELGSL